MKNLILLFCCCCFAGYAQKKANVGRFILNGTVTGRDTGRITLSYYDKNYKWTENTAYLQQGRFSFASVIDGVTFAKITGNMRSTSVNDPNYVDIFIEPNNITAVLTENDFKHAVITGSVAQRSFDTLCKQVEVIYTELAPLDAEYTRLKLAYLKGDKSQGMLDNLKAIQLKVKPYLDRRDAIYYHYVRTHPHDYLSAGIMNNFMLLSRMPVNSGIMLYDNLDPQVRNSAMGKEVYRQLQAIAETERSAAPAGTPTVASIAPLFTKNDINGQPVKLADYKGKKYVLLDFWATWCGPCKAFTPHLKDIYAKYATKGLEVISISHDRNTEDWIAGVKDEKMDKWRNIYTGFNAAENEMAKAYGIQAIPTVILIDMDGKIIGRYVGTDQNGDIAALKQQLTKLLK